MQGIFQTPYKTISEVQGEDIDIVFWGVPYDAGVTYKPGARFGPTYLRKCSTSIYQYNNAQGVYKPDSTKILENITMCDLGDISSTVFSRNGKVFQHVYTLAQNISRSGALSIMIGGDHSLTFPAVTAMANLHKNITLIHLDAHHDLGEMNDYVEYKDSLHHGNFLNWCITQKNITQIISVGVRQLTPDKPVENEKIVRFPGREVFNNNILDMIKPDSPCYISIDVDLLDPSVVSATGTLIANGWSITELTNLVRYIIQHRRVIGFDIMELNDSDNTEISGISVSSLIINLIEAYFHRD